MIMQREASGIDVRIAETLDGELRAALASLDGLAPLLRGMAGYHLGFLDESLRAVDGAPESRGKRFRPALAMLCCAAAGGTVERAGPLAAAIELLHNFTLVHDDIQDNSPLRRRRPTVWKLWGEEQAINAGDALFALAHRALYRLRGTVPAGTLLDVAEAFEQTTLEIVGGQVVDLTFEEGDRVAVDDYLAMIAGKTAAIVRFAAWSGAVLGGADDERAARYGAFGQALGLGFQIQDDLLGIWGTPDVTGKATADDIRRRKQSLPIVCLFEGAAPAEREHLQRIYAAPSIEPAEVELVLAALGRHRVEAQVRDLVRVHHDEADRLLGELGGGGAGEPVERLRALVAQLAARHW
jgi:geranylgeranyl diphosphate synthase type I